MTEKIDAPAVQPTRALKLDKIDRRIIADLLKDGRITNVDLAKNAGISAPPCLRRARHPYLDRYTH